MVWKLEATTGEQAGQSVIVDRDMLVGRHQEADVLLPFADVSRRQATLLLKDKTLWVEDLSSSNGTFVNDIRIEKATQIQSGDQLRFSSVAFIVSVVEVERVMPTTVVDELGDQEQSVGLTPAQKMNEQGMPSLSDRAAETTINANGMPVNIGIPKPAPIPTHVDVNVRTENIEMEIPTACVEQEQDAQKNITVGLISVIVIIILVIAAWFFFN